MTDAPTPGKPPDTYWSAAARPTLFSAAAWPDLIVAVLLAHLMSPRLWALARRAVKKAGLDRAARIDAIHRFVNHRFYHAGKLDFARFWGLQEQQYLTDPVERAESEYAMSVLSQCMPQSISGAPTIAWMMNWLRLGICPQYAYPTIEVIQALPAVCSKVSRRTLGVTCCLDECVLLAALAVAAGCCKLNEMVILGPPFHYALFILPDGPGVWLNGKRGMMDEAAWRAAAGRSAAAIQASFEEKMVFCDRFVAPAGYCRLPGGPATLPSNRAAALAEKLGRFFGADVRQVQSAVACAAPASGGEDAHALLAQLDGCADHEAFEARVRELSARTGHPLFEASLYAFRAPDVRCPAAYVEAARRGFSTRVRSGEVIRPGDALEIGRGIAGAESIFGASGRVALPDEVLLLGTASPSERGLLCHTLLSLSPTLGAEAETAARLVGGPDAWRLTWHGRTVPDTG